MHERQCHTTAARRDRRVFSSRRARRSELCLKVCTLPFRCRCLNMIFEAGPRSFRSRVASRKYLRGRILGSVFARATNLGCRPSSSCRLSCGPKDCSMDDIHTKEDWVCGWQTQVVISLPSSTCTRTSPAKPMHPRNNKHE